VRADRPALWRRPLLVLIRSRSGWARAYTRRQLRLADEDLLSTEPLARHVDEAADAVERTPHPQLADKHRQLRRCCRARRPRTWPVAARRRGPT
jgi:hypothetical protein